MFKRMLLIGFLSYWCYVPTFAQTVTVSVDDTTHVQDSLRTLNKEQEEILHAYQQARNLKLTATSRAVDSVERNLSIIKKKIPSDKQLRAIRDSLEKVTGFKVPLEDVKKYLSEADMIQLINSHYPEYPKISDADKFISASKDSLSPVAPQLPGLPTLALSPESLINLTPLPGRTIETKYLKYIDSVRAINLKQERLKLKEKVVSEKSKLVNLRPKPTFRQRSYFEGILGLMAGKSMSIYQASPALGFHFADYFSLGAGPSLMLRTVDGKLEYDWAVRAFSKVEFFKRQLYLQVEDSMNPSQESPEKVAIDKHNVLVGGGVLLSMKSRVTLNFSLLYRVNESKLSVTELSPFVFRVGISTIKIKK